MPIAEVRPDGNRQLQEIADVLAKSKKVVVVTGAGISTNIGIPDFRSENGLYALIQAQYEEAVQLRASASTPTSTRSGTPFTTESEDATPPSSQASFTSYASSRRSNLPSNIKGRDLFDSLVWTNPLSTMIFYRFIASLRRKIREEVRNTTPTHKFIRALRDGGRLVRCYTQNIDGLEAREGLCLDLKRGKGSRSRFLKNVVSKPRPEGPTIPGCETDGGCEVVQLHGDLETLRCGLCSELCSWEDEDRENILLSGNAPECHSCASKNENRRFSGKRGMAVGGLRPNVVLYGEEHPSADLLSPITTHDLKLGPDVLVILGTSLRVHGLKIIVREFAKAVHAREGGKVILVNRTRPAESAWSKVIDYWVGMDCDEWVADLRQRRGDIWERQGALRLPVVKETKSKVVKSKKEKTTRKILVVIKKKETTAKTATAAKERSVEKVVDARPATKGRTERPKAKRLRLPVHRIPTPLTDGSDVAPPVCTSKRKILNLHEDIMASPPKRKKGNARSWAGGTQSAHGCNETLFVEVPLKREKRTTTEQPLKAARTRMRRIV
ncbi:MAG: hypothetical protein M1840_003746 [Geoglossum simile]|nr:MAG: hypothetical protein M1840_003746 [Geoglossum simile]